jgi:hypothetical protein
MCHRGSHSYGTLTLPSVTDAYACRESRKPTRGWTSVADMAEWKWWPRRVRHDPTWVNHDRCTPAKVHMA